MHTTNYIETLIEVAPDCPVKVAEIPEDKEYKTIARMQYEMISKNPYKYSSDDVIFGLFAARNGTAKADQKKAREIFFAKGQACLRNSPLGKRYGFGVHNDKKGKIALYAMESAEYRKFMSDAKIKKIKAMRSSRK
jgi:hypothetical protein